jgi:hypothetical protein
VERQGNAEFRLSVYSPGGLLAPFRAGEMDSRCPEGGILISINDDDADDDDDNDFTRHMKFTNLDSLFFTPCVITEVD